MSDFCGIIELIALHKITQKNLYLKVVNDMIKAAKEIKNGLFKSILWRDLEIALKMEPNNELLKSFFNKRSFDKGNEMQLLPLLETNISFNNRKKLLSSFIKRSENYTIYDDLSFDTSFIRILSHENKFELAKDVAIAALESDDITATKSIKIATQASFLDDSFHDIFDSLVFNSNGYLVYINE